MSEQAAVGDVNFPGGGIAYVGNQWLNNLAGGAPGQGTGTPTYWAAINPHDELLCYLEFGNEVSSTVTPQKITMGVSSLSAGYDSNGSAICEIGIGLNSVSAFSGTSVGLDSWGADASKISIKWQPTNNKTLESLVNVSAGGTSGAVAGQVFTFNGTTWIASGSTGGGGGGGADAVLRAPTSTAESTITAPTTSVVGFTVIPQTANTYALRVHAPGGGVPADFDSFNIDQKGKTFISNLKTHGVTCESQISIAIEAGQTSAPFVVSDSGGNFVWYIDASANLFTSGGIDVSGNKITQVGTPTATDDAATKLYVDQSSSGVSGDYILKDGSVAFTGNQSMGSNKLTSVTNPTADQDAATKVYVDINTVDVSANYILKAGTVAFTGNQSMGSNKLTSVTNPTANQDAATKYYVDLMASSPSGNYILKDGSVAFTAAVSGVSGTTDNTLATKGYVDSHTEDVSGNYILKDGTVAFTGNQSMGSNKLTSVTNPTALQDAATKHYVDLMASSPSGNYILKDGTVAFTGDQSMGSNKLTSVADPTADRDAANKGYVDAHTEDVSGNYILKSGEVSFTGAVAGVSGTADASLTTNLMCFSRQFHHTAYRSGSFSNGQQIRLFLNTTDNDANFVIPAGDTLKILAAYGRCKSGGTAGTTTWTLGIQTWETQAHSGARDWDLATGTTTDTNSYINIMARGTLASPLATIVGADDPVGMVFLEHANGGGGSSGNDKHTIDVYGVFVDS